MENMENKVYKCAICGEEYSTIVGRNKCETRCVAKQKQKKDEEAKRTAEAKRAAEQETRTKELENAIIATNEMIGKTSDLLEKYLNDYRTFSTELDCYWIGGDPIDDIDDDECDEDCCDGCCDYLFYVM